MTSWQGCNSWYWKRFPRKWKRHDCLYKGNLGSCILFNARIL